MKANKIFQLLACVTFSLVIHQGIYCQWSGSNYSYSPDAKYKADLERLLSFIESQKTYLAYLDKAYPSEEERARGRLALTQIDLKKREFELEYPYKFKTPKDLQQAISDVATRNSEASKAEAARSQAQAKASEALKEQEKTRKAEQEHATMLEKAAQDRRTAEHATQQELIRLNAKNNLALERLKEEDKLKRKQEADFIKEREELEKRLEMVRTANDKRNQEELEKRRQEFEEKQLKERQAYEKEQQELQKKLDTAREIDRRAYEQQKAQAEREFAQKTEEERRAFEKARDEANKAFQKEQNDAQKKAQEGLIKRQEDAAAKLQEELRKTQEIAHKQMIDVKEKEAALAKEKAEHELKLEKDYEATLRAKRELEQKHEAQLKIIDAQSSEAKTKIEVDGKWGRLQKMFDDITSDPNRMKTIAFGISLSAVGIYGARLGYGYLNSLIGKPHLVKEASFPTSLSERIAYLLGRKKLEKLAVDDIVLPKKLQQEFEAMVNLIKLAHQRKTPFPSMCFFGHPGTGKTFGAKIIAQNSGLPWIVIAGSSFSQYARGKDIFELDKILRWAEMNGPAVIFFDEADSAFPERGTVDDKKTDFVNFFLSNIEEQYHKNLVFIYATNRPERLDRAIRSRTAKSYYYPLPDEEVRHKMIEKYISKVLINGGFKVSPEVYENLSTIAAQTEGFSGREIKGMVLSIKDKLMLSNEQELSLPVVQTVVDAAVEQHKQQAAMDQVSEGVNTQFFGPKKAYSK